MGWKKNHKISNKSQKQKKKEKSWKSKDEIRIITRNRWAKLARFGYSSNSLFVRLDALKLTNTIYHILPIFLSSFLDDLLLLLSGIFFFGRPPTQTRWRFNRLTFSRRPVNIFRLGYRHRPFFHLLYLLLLSFEFFKFYVFSCWIFDTKRTNDDDVFYFVSTDRQRGIWCCCLNRSLLLTFGLRTKDETPRVALTFL